MRTVTKILASLIVVTALAATFYLPARADIAPPEAPPGSLLLPGDPVTQVRMMAETVTLKVGIDPGDAQGAIAHTTARFRMRNLGGEPEEMQVRFPLSFIWWDSGWYPEISDLRVVVDGRGVSTKRQVIPYSSNGDYGMTNVDIPWAVFDVTFPPAQDVSIEVSYTIQGYGYYPYEDFRYIMETGAGWKDSIGSADIIVRLPYAADEKNVWQEAETGYSCCSSRGALAGNEIRWHFENLEPTPQDNIEVSLVAPGLWQRLLKEQKTVEANPNDGEAWGRLAKAYKEIIRMPKGYLRTDRVGVEMLKLSRAAYEKCLALLPEDALWHAGYADLLWPHYYFDVYMQGNPEEAGLLSTVLIELQTSLRLDPQNELAPRLLEEISYSIPEAVARSESGYVLLGLTATFVPPTPYIVETPSEMPTQARPATATPSPEPSPTPQTLPDVSPTSPRSRQPQSPLCGAAAFPALGAILWARWRRRNKSQE